MSDKGIIKLFKFIGYASLLIIGMGTAQKFPQWFAPYLLANYPYLVPLVILLIIGGFILASSKRLRKGFVYQLREFYKDLLFLLRETYKESRSLVPKNKLKKLVLNIGFIVGCFFVLGFTIEFLEDFDRRLTVYEGTPQHYLILTLLFGGILFITQFLWLPNGFRDIANTFSKAKKVTKKILKSNAKYLSKSNISDADELKKYAELRDQGIITEEEFQAKKKQLLDL